jgi:hypothetical protein
MYINSDYVKRGDIDPYEFFIKEDVTDEVMFLYDSVSKNLRKMSNVVDMEDVPEINIGKDCNKPYECPLKAECWKILPENNVFELYWGKDKAARFMAQGIKKIADIKDISGLNPKQKVQYECAKSGSSFVDKENIRSFLEELVFPIYLLDFETFATAKPLFEGTRPYQNIPFQFSCHIYTEIGKRYEKHISFIYDGDSDPRPEFLDNLRAALGYGVQGRPSGSILVYYESFEISILRQLSEAFKDHERWIEDALSRIKDLFEPFGNFFFYDNMQKGSASLKKVLPAVTGSGYEGMDIDNGQIASIRYLQHAYRKTRQSEKDPGKIYKDLEEYCGLDTSGMMEILIKLEDLLV